MDPLAKLVDSYDVWVAEEDERESFMTACIEEYFGYPEYYLECNLGLYEKMEEYLDAYLFKHRGDDIPEGGSHWDYLTKKWSTDLSEYGLPECLKRGD